VTAEISVARATLQIRGLREAPDSASSFTRAVLLALEGELDAALGELPDVIVIPRLDIEATVRSANAEYLASAIALAIAAKIVAEVRARASARGSSPTPRSAPAPAHTDERIAALLTAAQAVDAVGSSDDAAAMDAARAVLDVAALAEELQGRSRQIVADLIAQVFTSPSPLSQLGRLARAGRLVALARALDAASATRLLLCIIEEIEGSQYTIEALGPGTTLDGDAGLLAGTIARAIAARTTAGINARAEARGGDLREEGPPATNDALSERAAAPLASARALDVMGSTGEPASIAAARPLLEAGALLDDPETTAPQSFAELATQVLTSLKPIAPLARIAREGRLLLLSRALDSGSATRLLEHILEEIDNDPLGIETSSPIVAGERGTLFEFEARVDVALSREAALRGMAIPALTVEVRRVLAVAIAARLDPRAPLTSPVFERSLRESLRAQPVTAPGDPRASNHGTPSLASPAHSAGLSADPRLSPGAHEPPHLATSTLIDAEAAKPRREVGAGEARGSEAHMSEARETETCAAVLQVSDPREDAPSLDRDEAPVHEEGLDLPFPLDLDFPLDPESDVLTSHLAGLAFFARPLLDLGWIQAIQAIHPAPTIALSLLFNRLLALEDIESAPADPMPWLLAGLLASPDDDDLAFERAGWTATQLDALARAAGAPGASTLDEACDAWALAARDEVRTRLEGTGMRLREEVLCVHGELRLREDHLQIAMSFIPAYEALLRAGLSFDILLPWLGDRVLRFTFT
jgi:hypothetical protein